jgi:hypothetical protein
MTIARQLGYFGYLTYDTVVWVCVRCSRKTNILNVFPSGQRYQVNYPEAWNIPEGPKNLKPFLARWYLVQHCACCTQGEFPTRFTHAPVLLILTQLLCAKGGRLAKETRKIRGQDEKNVGEENARKSQLRVLQT